MSLKMIVEFESKMHKSVDYFTNELKGLRSGRASTGLVENIRAEYYGSPTPLKQLANISVQQSDIILIKPFDTGCLKEIEKAIKNSDLSIAPIVDGKSIRLSIPPLSEERRKQIVGQIKQLGEQAKVNIRNIRRDANKYFEDQEKAKAMSEDDLEKAEKQIDDITKKYINNADAIIKQKSDEIMKN
jgi:ribosome recycling factor